MYYGKRMLTIVKNTIQNTLNQYYPEYRDRDYNVSFIENSNFGDVAANIAMVLAKELKVNTQDLAADIILKINNLKDIRNLFSKIDVAGPGFINFTFDNKYVQATFTNKENSVENILNNIKQKDILKLKDKVTLVEYTDPNPFKVFHIGHLMTNIIGESIANIYNLSGANVKRINYQGDVGRHIAITIFSILQKDNYEKFEEFAMSAYDNSDKVKQKVIWLGQMYAAGYNIFKDAEEGKEVVLDFVNEYKKGFENISVVQMVAVINKKIYERSDVRVNRVYDMGKAWSMEYFEILYKILGTKFDKYIMESEAASVAINIVDNNLNDKGKGLFIYGEDNAVINKDFENGLHTRVFINKNGLPTYEAKDLGNMNIKMRYYPDIAESVVITASEVNDYFKVINFCIANIYPDLVGKLKHYGHGMMRFADGKMSSRKGNIIAGDDLIDEIKGNLKDKFVNSRIENKEEKDFVIEKVAVASVKYAVLKQSIGKDIIFDMEKVISVEGDSGPYIQYTYSRLCSVAKSHETDMDTFNSDQCLVSSENRDLLINILKLEDILVDTIQNIAPQKMCTYIIDLSRSINSWYGNNRIADNKENEYIAYKAKEVIKAGLSTLAIHAPERM